MKVVFEAVPRRRAATFFQPEFVLRSSTIVAPVWFGVALTVSQNVFPCLRLVTASLGLTFTRTSELVRAGLVVTAWYWPGIAGIVVANLPVVAFTATVSTRLGTLLTTLLICTVPAASGA